MSYESGWFCSKKPPVTGSFSIFWDGIDIFLEAEIQQKTASAYNFRFSEISQFGANFSSSILKYFRGWSLHFMKFSFWFVHAHVFVDS